MKNFSPRLEILPAPQRRLWNELVSPLVSDDNGLRIASLLDLAGTKASVVQVRGEAKDYLDLDWIT